MRSSAVTRQASDCDAEAAVLRTLVYHELFRHPLTAGELWKRLDRSDVTAGEVSAALDRLVAAGKVHRFDDMYQLSVDPEDVARRRAANRRATDRFGEAVEVGRRIARLPFVRGVGISGSLSKGVMHDDSDCDFFIITSAGRLWLVRTMLVVMHRTMPNPEMLCPNYLIDDQTLALKRQDPYTAMELATVLPVSGTDIFGRLRAENAWAGRFWPNLAQRKDAVHAEHAVQDGMRRARRERLIPARLATLADRFLHWLTTRHIRAKLPEMAAREARGDVAMTRSECRMHVASWRDQALRHVQARTETLTTSAGGGVAVRPDTRHVLFAHSYFYRFDPKQWQFAQPYPPIGTLYAAAVAREMGYTVSLFDAGLAESDALIGTHLAKARPGTLVLYDDGFNYLTKMCLTRMREAALRMIAEARLSGARVVVSSSDAADHYDLYLDAGADVVIRGEGEATLRALLTAWEADEPIDEIDGIAFRRSGETVLTMPRAVMRDLDALPDPAWDLVDFRPYQAIWTRRHGRFSLNLATTRGCPYKCNWCAKPIYGNRYNVRSPERVVEEIAMLIERTGARHFWMADDIFGLKPGWVARFAELVAARGLRFGYTIQSRADLMLREGELDALAASGLETVWFGAESGSQKILDAMDKGITRTQIDRLVPMLRARGIRSAMFLQLGYLGETAEDLQQTLEMVETLVPDQLGISVSYPLPGTPFYDRVQTMLGDKRNWRDSDDLAMMFPGTYPPAYYRLLHRHIHRRHRVALVRARMQGRLSSIPGRTLLRDAASGAKALSMLPVDAVRLNRLRRGRG